MGTGPSRVVVAACRRTQADGAPHDALLGGLGAGDLVDEPAIGGDQDPVGEADQLQHIGGDDDDGDSPAPRASRMIP